MLKTAKQLTTDFSIKLETNTAVDVMSKRSFKKLYTVAFQTITKKKLIWKQQHKNGSYVCDTVTYESHYTRSSYVTITEL